MSRQLPANLVSNFTRALKTFQLSKNSFTVLCSLPGPSQPVPRPPQETPQTLLVLDSSFNPPTLAHQRMALSALREKRYASSSRVLLLLAINNADKAPKPASFPQRLAMMYIFALDLLAALDADTGAEVDLAVTTEPYFSVKSNAIKTGGFYGEDTENMEQIFLTGFDTLIRIFDPKYYPNDSMKQALDPFFAYSKLRVTMRTDADWGGAAEQIAYLEDLKNGKLEGVGGRKEWATRVEMVEGRQEGDEIISSTKVRDAVQSEDWDKLRSFVSDDITNWVKLEKLYRED